MSPDIASPHPKTALVSIGIGRFQRGYERYFVDLHGVLCDRMDITLYGSRSNRRDARLRVPPLLPITTAMARVLPFGKIPGECVTYKHDCVSFGVSLLAELLRRRYDVIHIIDLPLAKVLRKLQAVFRFPGRMLLTNGSCIPPDAYPRVDHIHHVAQPLFLEAVSAGVPESSLTLVPCGIHTRRFASVLSRDELRDKHGIARNTFVILAVSAVKRAHKRVDHIIEEVSQVDGDILLWIDGDPEDPTIPDLARDRLGNRCRITHSPSDQVAELYNLADVLVHASLSEAFGLAVVEALSTGLMVLVHDSPHYHYLTEDRDCLVEMSQTGRLAARLKALIARGPQGGRRNRDRADRVCQRFDWNALAPAYIEMYRKVAGASPPTLSGDHS